MKPSLTDLQNLARGAGIIVRAGYHKHNNIEFKGEIELVTETDRRSEAYLLGEIGSRFPGHHIVAEEGGSVTGEGDCTWYIDPLDGTTNFAHKLPIFSISIAFECAGELTLGVVYDPLSDEMFSAEKGKGAFLNGEPIQAAGQTELSASLLVTGFHYSRFTNPDNNLDHFANFTLRVQGIRRLGSAALDLCYVACGRVDGYWEGLLESYDIAAGILIAREAGAMVTKTNGQPNPLETPHSILAANPILHEKMLEVLGLS